MEVVGLRWRDGGGGGGAEGDGRRWCDGGGGGGTEEVGQASGRGRGAVSVVAVSLKSHDPEARALHCVSL